MNLPTSVAERINSGTKRHFILYTISSIVLWPIMFILILVAAKRINDGIPQLDFNTFALYSLYSTLASLLNFSLGYMLFLHGKRNVL